VRLSTAFLAPAALALAAFAVGVPAGAAPAYAKSAKAVSKSAKARSPKRKAAAKPAAPAEPPTPPVLSDTSQRVIRWITMTGNNAKLPYIIIDKPNANLTLFDADGNVLGQAPVLLGITLGDDSSPGIGGKSLSEMGPAEKTTPAGRFVARYGAAAGHKKILWVDYADAVALHPVVTTNKKERRLQRLNSPTIDDNRISFGCINVPTKFYAKTITPAVKKAVVVYILPDKKPLEQVFPALYADGYLAGSDSSHGKGASSESAVSHQASNP
jgi:hypothetical protein